jgi:hypothetical protein
MIGKIEKKKKEQRKRRFAQPRTSVSVCASVLLRLRWIPPCLSLTAAVFNIVPRVPVFIHAYYEDQKKGERKKERKKETTER